MIRHGQIVRHADHIEAVRVRFDAVHEASLTIACDDDAYGRLCRWITENFQAKHDRQDELVEYVEENLRLIGQGLCRLAGVEVRQADPVRKAAVPSLVAPAEAQARVAMEQVELLRVVLDQLTGKPDVIAAHAETWYNVAVAQREMAEELEDFIELDVPAWDGADEHQRLMGHNIDAIKGLSAVSAALGEITESVGVLVAQTRRLVRELVVGLVAAPTDATFRRLACRIAVYGVALNATLTHLEKRLNG